MRRDYTTHELIHQKTKPGTARSGRPDSLMVRDGTPADSSRDSHWEARFRLIDSHPF